MSKRIAVIGAGPGGLAAAMLLAHRGFQVQVYEKADRIGGRNAELTLGDYRFDIGPTFLMMKYVLEELFENAGRRIEDYLDCRALDPMYRLTFAHASMLVHSDPEAMRLEIERCFPGEGDGLERFLREESVRFRKLYPCLQRDYGSLTSFLSPTLLAALPHIAFGRSLYDVLSGYFKSEELRLSFTFQSKYLGMSPWDCPGLFAMIPYTEHAHGVFHVMGGLNRIPAAFAKVAEEEGATIHTSCGVKEVLRNGRTVTGLLLDNGETVACDEVVMNADFGHAMTTLFPEQQSLGKYREESLAKRPYSCSTMMLYLGLDRTYPEAEHHIIAFADDYRRCLEDITRHKSVSEELSVYVRNAAPLDPSCAPAGHSALYILAPVPNNTSGIDWDKYGPIYRDRVLDLIAARTCYGDLRPHIRAERMITPADWERSGIFLGATFNMGHGWDQMLYFRPHNRFELFDNLYLVGGGTHPGSGLPTIFESARISSNLLCDKYGIPHPTPRPFPPPPTN